MYKEFFKLCIIYYEARQKWHDTNWIKTFSLIRCKLKCCCPTMIKRTNAKRYKSLHHYISLLNVQKASYLSETPNYKPARDCLTYLKSEWRSQDLDKSAAEHDARTFWFCFHPIRDEFPGRYLYWLKSIGTQKHVSLSKWIILSCQSESALW